jgi:hypothetical protein
LWRLVVTILRSPALLAVLTLISMGLVVFHTFGPVPLVVAVVLVFAALVGWRLRWPGSFDRWVYCTWRSGWRSGLIYSWRWAQAMTRPVWRSGGVTPSTSPSWSG